LIVDEIGAGRSEFAVTQPPEVLDETALSRDRHVHLAVLVKVPCEDNLGTRSIQRTVGQPEAPLDGSRLREIAAKVRTSRVRMCGRP
jgi:hypothetical protein